MASENFGTGKVVGSGRGGKANKRVRKNEAITTLTDTSAAVSWQKNKKAKFKK